MAHPTLEDAVALAALAHRGQKDKAGRPYILHPLRVMLACGDVETMAAAVLHDVVEDTSLTLDDLALKGFSDEILDTVDRLSRRRGETYEEFIERLGPSPMARRVKLADLDDNLDASRLPEVTPKAEKRFEKYRRARARLLEWEDGDLRVGDRRENKK